LDEFKDKIHKKSQKVKCHNKEALKTFIIAFKNACENETLIQDLFSRAELD
jgi:hypothetical protein